ncbi:MAG: PIN domain-containing protein [Rubellimicrobium sp.]|nr:PIN domain-containing protein [Rubellimicrobium sp.]
MRVLIDANVLYPTVLREIVLGCAQAGLFEPRWSARIAGEWIHAAGRLSPEQRVLAEGEVALAEARFPRARVDARVEVGQGIEERLWLPDPGDVHVLAAAIAGHCDAILTMNARDFPRDVLAAEGIERRDPDGFLCDLALRSGAAVAAVVDAAVAEAARLSGEGWDRRRLLRKVGLHRLARVLG